MYEPEHTNLQPPPPLPAAAIVTPPVRFCTACGTPWQPDQIDCPACAARRARLAHPDLRHHTVKNPLFSPIALYFAFLACAVIGIIAGLAGANELTLDFTLSIMITAIVLLWSLFSLKDVLPPLYARFNAAWLPAAAAASIATFAIASAALWVLAKLLHIPILHMTDSFAAAGYGLPMMTLLIAVQPAVIEEIAFRGIIFSRLQTVLSPIETVFVSALMFMIIHLAVPSFPHLFVMGLALGWLRLVTGSLWPGMVLHFGHNLLCILFEQWRLWPI